MKINLKKIIKLHVILINFIIINSINANNNVNIHELDLSLDTKYNTQNNNYDNLPYMGDDLNNSISDKEESLLGRQVFFDILRSVPLEQNLFIQEYIQSLGEKLVSHSPNIAKHKFKFFVIDSQIINAFALLGGYIGINKGLIELAQNETELASVMSHEIAHVTQRHIARSIQNQSKIQIPYIAGLLGALILSAYNPELAQGALATTMASAEQININFTRSNEEEADRVGIQILANSGYNPNGMADFFEKMHKATSNGLLKIPELLRTHPITESRVSEAISFAKNYKFRFYNDNLKFHLIKILFKFENQRNIVELKNSFTKQLKSGFYNNQSAAKFGLALSYMHSNNQKDKTEAIYLLEKLYQKAPIENIYTSNLAQSLINQNKIKHATKILKEYLDLFPSDYAIISQYSNLLLDSKNGLNNKTELLYLEKLIKQYIDTSKKQNHIIYPSAYNLLAKIQLTDKRTFVATQNQAEYLANIGNFPAAVHQLNSLLKFGKLQKYEKKIIMVRIKEMKTEYEQLNN